MTSKKTKTTKTKSKKTKVVCLSHKEDADGISSAALIREAFGGDSVLVDYPGQMEALEQIASDKNLKSLFICDLGLSKKNQDEFVEILTNLRKRKASITYIDHHDIDSKILKQLKKIGVKMIHNTNECTTVLAYDKF
ncbi:MAG: DHH family phosphoesterase, partial [Nitrosopumilaceae archaeon]